ncbi:MAG: tetratricopeptide repeat protein [Methanobacterium sp. Maddingley MBC34]|nr:MAG: tetratricopeptide repeat protein [Methanobacterium sp. Maddingley MBC34]
MKSRIRTSFAIQSFFLLFLFADNFFSFFNQSKSFSLFFILTIPPVFVVTLCGEIAYFNKKIVLTILAVVLALTIGLISYQPFNPGVDIMQYYEIAGLSTIVVIAMVLWAFKEWDKIEKAVKQYDDILEMNPYDITSLNNKGVELANLKKHKWAMEYFDKALKVDPNDSAALHNKGVLITKFKKTRKDTNKANEYFDRALEADPAFENAKSSGKIILET